MKQTSLSSFFSKSTGSQISPKKDKENQEQNVKAIKEEPSKNSPQIVSSKKRKATSPSKNPEDDNNSHKRKRLKKKEDESNENTSNSSTLDDFLDEKETSLKEEVVNTEESDESKKLTKVQFNFSKTSEDEVNGEEITWDAGQPVPYLALSKTFEKIEQISARLKITEYLCNLFSRIIKLTPNDILPCIYLASGRLAPEYEGLELGIGENLLMKAVANATGRTMASLKSDYDSMGDLGLVAKASRTNQKTMYKPAPLTVKSVFNKFKEIASLQGHSSMNKKKQIIEALLVACRESEAQFIIRTLQGKLRIGLAEKTIIAALAHAFVSTDPKAFSNIRDTPTKFQKANDILRSVYSQLPSFDLIIPALLSSGIEELPKHCFLTPGIPIRPMLAHPTKSIQEVYDRFEKTAFTCEFKYDGERAQVHYFNETFKIYSRNMENHTSKYPDIIHFLPSARSENVTSYVLDCEVVAIDKQTNKILPFQILSTRARKDVSLESIKVQICLFAFDLLFLNGQSLISLPFPERREKLHSSFKEVDGFFRFAQAKDTSDLEEVTSFLNEAVQGNCEGLMLKIMDQESVYEPSKRSFKWLKLKKDYLDGMGDSLDLVPIGAYYGRGKRTGVYGGYLLAIYDEETETFQSICKTGTGFSDELLKSHYDFFKNHTLPEPKAYYDYSENLKPDVWLDTVQVWELKAADLSISPVHKAAVGLVDPSKGIALRFPRFIRIREDKKPEDATSSTQVVEMYRSQKINSVSQQGEEEDDGYF